MDRLPPAFVPPSNLDIPIWRYMDLAKFMSLLENEALHFARADLMSDKFEGSLSEPSLTWERQRFREMSDESWTQWRAQLENAALKIRAHTYLSCWHMNEHESVAMWNIYRNNDANGIAIRSTYKKLSNYLNSAEHERIYVGVVNYIDYKTELIPWHDSYFPYVHKRKSFEYERELRALFSTNYVGEIAEGNENTENPTYDFAPPGPPVLPIEADLDLLIDAVFVSPGAPQWFGELVQQIVTRYGRTWPVVHSYLDVKPLF